MKGMCWLLLLCAAASAQPVFGPYEIVTTNTRIRDLETCVRGDTVDAVWIQDSFVVWQRFGVAQAALLGDAETVYALHNWPKLELHDLTARTDTSWCCVVYEQDDQSRAYDINLVFTTIEATVFVPLFDGHGTYGLGYGYPRGFSVSVDSGGETATAWTWVDRGVWSSRLFMVVALVSEDFLELWADQAATELNAVHDWLSSALVTSIENDSAIVVSMLPMGHGTWANLFPSANNGVGTSIDFFGNAMIEAGRIHGDTLFALFELANSGIVVGRMQISDSLSVDLDSLGVVELDFVSAAAFHRNYGFAVVEANPGYLLLARMDTTGQPAQPVGVLYETDGSSFIANADVTITDDGKVVCVWSEYSDWSEGPRVIKIAWVDWVTYLDAPDENAPSVPSEFTLSAYPNPFNSSVTISFDLPRSGDVELNIYDLNGRLVETLRDEFSAAGTHTLQWSPRDAASGVYFATLHSGTVRAVRKVLYLK